MPRGFQIIVLFSLACVVTLSMGACPFLPPVINPKAVASPVFHPSGQTFTDTLDVTISSDTAGAVIHFTTDGSTPSASKGTMYTGAITLTQTTTLKAVATKDEMDPSAVVEATYTQSSPGVHLSIVNPVVLGSLFEGQTGTISVACEVVAQGTSVQSVVADLSQVGGPAAQPLDKSGTSYTWSGPVTANSTGTKTITFTASDGAGVTGTATATIAVAAPTNQPPTLTQPDVSGSLVATQSGSVLVSCTATDADGTVRSVVADLTEIGGDATQSLTQNGDVWSWTGPVTPPTTGTKSVTFTATDDQGATTTDNATIDVGVPVAGNQPPLLTSPIATGSLVKGQSGSVTVSCTATDADGTVESVVADLSALGGPAAQALTGNGNTWSWTGTLTPPTVGTMSIVLVATDNEGGTGQGTATIDVASPPVSTTLFGTWSGDVTYSQSLGRGSPLAVAFVQPSTITFSADNQPQTLAMFFVTGHQVFLLPADALRSVGDKQTSSFTNNGTTTTITGTVKNISRSAAAFSIDLDVAATFAGNSIGGLSGTYHWEAGLPTTNQLSWNETTVLHVTGLSIDVNVGSTGTLARQ
jgi:hypothetical protein